MYMYMYMYACLTRISFVIQKFAFISFCHICLFNELKSNVETSKNANIVYRTEVYRISICLVIEDNNNRTYQTCSYHTKTITSTTNATSITR